MQVEDEFLVLDLIGACLRHAHRKKSLRASILVCKRWRKAMQPHLFYKAKISFQDEMEKWSSIAAQCPHIISECVRKVEFDPIAKEDHSLSGLTPEIMKDPKLFEKWMTGPRPKKKDLSNVPLDPPAFTFPVMSGVTKLSYSSTYVHAVLVANPQVINYLSHFPNVQSVEICFEFATVNDADQFFAALPPLLHLRLIEVGMSSVRSKRLPSKSKCDFSRLETLYCEHMRGNADWIVDLLTFRPRQSPKNLKKLVIEDCLSIDAIERLVQISSASLEWLCLSNVTDSPGVSAPGFVKPMQSLRCFMLVLQQAGRSGYSNALLWTVRLFNSVSARAFPKLKTVILTFYAETPLEVMETVTDMLLWGRVTSSIMKGCPQLERLILHFMMESNFGDTLMQDLEVLIRTSVPKIGNRLVIKWEDLTIIGGLLSREQPKPLSEEDAEEDAEDWKDYTPAAHSDSDSE